MIKLPKDLLNLCTSYLSEDEKKYIENRWDEFKEDLVCNIAAKNGWLDLLKWARDRLVTFGNGCNWDSKVCRYAALNGHLEVLKWARENGCPWDYLTCSYAVENGHLEVIKWLEDSLVTFGNNCPCNGTYHKNKI